VKWNSKAFVEAVAAEADGRFETLEQVAARPSLNRVPTLIDYCNLRDALVAAEARCTALEAENAELRKQREPWDWPDDE